MRLTVLGCRAGMPSDGQASSGYLVTTDSTKILLDCGPGIATALSGVCPPAALDAVVLSHLHNDHCHDLLPIGKKIIADQLGNPLAASATVDFRPPIPLYVPVGGRGLLDALSALFPLATLPLLEKAFEVAFDVIEYEPGDTFEVGDCVIGLHELRHALPNCGVRVESAQAGLAYTGDTGVTDALVTLAGGVDLFLAEASLVETDTGDHGHLSAADAARAAHRAGAGRLVLTHLPSAEPAFLAARAAEAAGEFGGPVLVAAPGSSYEISKDDA
ncbi:MBL fold metallo-hydrolase [Nonomuraea sp. NPDC005650]|uniref:MBL fold metallo-hydrolase n=1 Tax=Nonomuraea sp. NPDC005650 TaxID=3157045 RepID=UPI0033B7735E